MDVETPTNEVRKVKMMRLFVLGAGQGKRLAPETDHAPKCLLGLPDGTTFISRLVKIAEETGFIREVTIVTGHGSNKVEHAIKNYPTTIDVDTLYNPFFEVAGPIVSLWVAHDRMSDRDFMVCNGDTLYGQHAFERIRTEEKEVIRLCIDDSSEPSPDDMKVQIDEEGNLLKVGKDITPLEANAVSIGLLLVKGEPMRRAFLEAIVELMHQSENVHKWQVWHKVLNKMASEGVPIETVTVNKEDWTEVDTPEDLNDLRAQLRAGDGPVQEH